MQYSGFPPVIVFWEAVLFICTLSIISEWCWPQREIYIHIHIHTSYLNQGQRSTDKDLWKLIIMYTNGYNSISCFGWTLRSKIRRKSKNQRKSKSLILLIISLSTHLWIWFLLSLLNLIYWGICTKQEMELLPCDLTPCHLCQFFTDLRWGKMYG